jgi:ABC-type sugar transport system ATPase subunit
MYHYHKNIEQLTHGKVHTVSTVPVILECSHVTKRFGNTIAVNDVSLKLHQGQTMALVGENGAGKTTLMGIMVGEVHPDSGSIAVDGVQQHFRSPIDARKCRIAIVHQELSLFPDLTVAENIALGYEPLHSLPFIHARKLRAKAREALAQLGVIIDVDQLVARLSPSSQQLVEIAKALYANPRVLVLDEPTSSLEAHEAERLRETVRNLNERGTSVIFVSHRLDEVFSFATEISIMRDGRLVEQGPAGSYSHDALVTKMVGREITQVYPERVAPLQEDRQSFLQLSDISLGIIQHLSLTVTGGKIVGIGGLEGQGQHLLAEIVAGVKQPSHGTISLFGKPARLRSPRSAIRQGIVYVPPDRRTSGLMLPLSVKENLAVAALKTIHRTGLIQPATEKAKLSPIIKQLHLRYSRLSQPVSDLSGGNQQKVLFGRWLLVPTLRLLVLDDPTRGVDIGARSEIYALLRKLTQEGISILLISTDIMELIGLSDEIHVMYEGRITGTLPASEATEEAIMHLATMHDDKPVGSGDGMGARPLRTQGDKSVGAENDLGMGVGPLMLPSSASPQQNTDSQHYSNGGVQ